MKVSIITCSWNSEPLIDESIASVLAQDYPDIEQVFVDGGSTDGTLQRIQGLSGQVKWVTDVRGGIAKAMNVGAAMAGGEIIAHLHSDDYYLGKDVVSRAVALLEQSGAEWMFARMMSDHDGKLVKDNWKMPRYSRKRLIQGNFIAHPSVFMRKSLFERAGGFSSELKYAMDYDFWLRVSALAEPAYMEAELAAFRWHAGSTTTANRMASFEEDHQVRLRYASDSPVDRVLHALRYQVRKRRLLKQLAAEGRV
ncbi:MAG TPA: glycosyltransferase family 2 protein [Burkholderiaceae bacterium]|jgi:glycosyltransferase involved in cell wall biosynthesis